MLNEIRARVDILMLEHFLLKHFQSHTTAIVYFQTETLFPPCEIKSVAIAFDVRTGSICETFIGIVEGALGWLTFSEHL